jgi:hypothetical protein
MSSRETVVNRALSGVEYKSILLSDCERLLNNEQLLSPHIAFGRVSHTIRLVIHVDNPHVPESVIELGSVRNNNVPLVEAFPLQSPSAMAEVGALQLDRTISSPNAERLREGMPIPVHVRQQDGSVVLEQITYPPGSFPDLPAGEVMIKDVTEQARQQYALVEPESQTGEQDQA